MNPKDIAGWIGTLCLIYFAFTLCIPVALAGLVFLTLQAAANHHFNLVLLNIVSFCGFVGNL